MAAVTMSCEGVRALPALTVLVFVLCFASSVSVQPYQQNAVRVLYFPNSQPNFDFRSQLTEVELHKRELDILQLKNDIHLLAPDVVQYIPEDMVQHVHVRLKRAVDLTNVAQEVTEAQTGVLINFNTKYPSVNFSGRQFTLNSTSGNPEMFAVTDLAELKLRDGYHLDYEVQAMRTITFVVDATNPSNSSDVYRIRATLTVTNVDEPPVFETQPQPYQATVRTDTGSGYSIITLVATDPEGQSVNYEKNSVSPAIYNNRIELRTNTVNGVRQCELLTVGSSTFIPEGQTISITVSAREAVNGGQVVNTTVSVLIGVRPPQFYQSSYQGSMLENNQPQQTVYKLGTSGQLKVEWKTFQTGTVSVSLTSEGGGRTDDFTVQRTDNYCYIICTKVLDYEEANPKTQALILTATQTVGSALLTSTVPLTVEIQDANDNRPVFDQSQYLNTIPENTAVGQSVLEVMARDKDTGVNAEITYSLVNTQDFDILNTKVGNNTPTYKGIITIKRKLDYDRPEGPYYSFLVKATDHGTSPQTSTSNVRISVTNVNDESPKFLNQEGQVYEVLETAQAGQFITQVLATDGDGDKVFYSFSNAVTKFQIDRTSGLVTLTQSITASDDRFTLTIRATDDGSCCGSGQPILSSNITIYVQVYGANNERPDFKSCSQYSPSLNENSLAGTSVLKVTAEDNDRGPNGVVTYSLIQSGDVFNISSSTGLITVKVNIDREVTSFVQVTVLAKDGGTPPQEGYCTFRVTVNDVNDNPPRFDKPSYKANITINTPNQVPFLFVRAYDDDVGNNARINYSLPNNAEGRFSIIPENGYISLTNRLTQNDVGQSYSLTVMAKDDGSPSPLNTTVNVQVNVVAGGDTPPKWDRDYSLMSYSVNETVQQGYVIIENMACDSMIAVKSVEFQLIRDDGTTATQTEFFQTRQNGNLVSVLATGKFDYMKKKEHTIRIRCLNFGSVEMLNETNPKVVLVDTNNQIPEFQGLSATGRYSGNVQENKPAATSVVTVEATDGDSTSPFNLVTFSLLDGGDNFTIEPGAKSNTAVIRTKVSFDREERENYFLTVKAEDGAPSSLPGITNGQHNTATVVVNVKITDVNDNPPYFDKALYNISVEESIYINDLIYPAIEVTDPDTSDKGRHTYRILSGNTNNAFGIRNGLGNLFPLRKLDYEASDKNFKLVVEASDGLYSASTTVTVTVVDINDNSPVFDRDFYTVNNFYENDNNVPRYLITINATDADVDRPNSIRYSLEGSSFSVGDYFSINDQTGQLSILKPLDRDLPSGRANWQFTVKAADELTNPNFGYATVSVMPKDVNDNKPEFITDPLEASVKEGADKGYLVVKVQAQDMDNGDNGTVEFSIINIVDGANVARPNYFVIDRALGLVNTNVTGNLLDRETQDTYRLTIKLSDKGTPPMENQGVLTVTLSDINDEWPVFQQRIYRTDMSENLKSGEVIRVVAKDKDIGENARVFYSLMGESTHFTIRDIDNEGSVQIVPEYPVDYEDPTQRFFNLTVKAQDINSDHQDTCYLEIRVLDFNDNAPFIQPSFLNVNVSENASPGTVVANFTATDLDSTPINKEFEFSISRASDPRRHFSIDAVSGQVKVRRKLDRESQARHDLTILAIDKGSPPLSGTARLVVTVGDVNDNYPTFLEDYSPQVMENKNKGVLQQVQEVFATDPDAPPYGAPFGFKLDPACGADCSKFSFNFYKERAGGNGTATIATDTEFDREAQKYYLIPIIMWDMRDTNSKDSMTGTNTLTITIGDENDNRMKAGTQNIFVYNFKGQFGPIEIGRVYVEDADDWDLPDKTFTYTGPDWMKNYFEVHLETGMVTMKKGVPSSPVGQPYAFTVQVYDKLWKDTVTSTVSVTVEELSEEAVLNSGATRFKGTSAEEFIRIPHATSSEGNPKSSFQIFKELLAKKLNTNTENIQIISVQDVERGYTDVRYSVHGSPYYPSSQTDSIVFMKKKEFEDALGLTVDEVPIDACQEEVFEAGCYNYMNITGKPAMVNSNGTSFVGVEVFIQATEGCRALDFPEPNECSGDYCYHGGTCVKNDFGVLSCINCPQGFDGPRCQQLRHSFNGMSYAMYPTLEQCENSETSIEFITTQADGQLLYNGPMTTPAVDKPQDFISLQLSGGMPVLNIDHGSGSATLSLDGRDNDNKVVISTLADGKWHKIDIVRRGKFVEMIVDDCRAAGPSGSESKAPDTSPCQTSAATRGENSFLNVATLLQLGGRAPGHTYPQGQIISNTGFNGCVRNLIHNSKYYDLHYKQTPEVPSGENGCPREDQLCLDNNGNPKCGGNGTCIASFNSNVPATCLCKPGWKGTLCSEATVVRDLKKESFIQWRVKNNVQLLPYQLEVQFMYRTWDTNGVLFTVSSSDSTKRVTMELKDGHLQVLYNLGNQDNILLLNHTQASNGYWHVAKFKRVMHVATLTLDEGEGRNHASRRDPQDSVYMQLTSSSPMYGGASVTNPSGAQVLDRDLSNTCFQDVRLNGAYLPISSSSSENSLSTVADYVTEKNIENGCSRPDGCVPPPVCPLNAVCVNLWGQNECRCAPGYHELAKGVCESDCLPENPCFLNALCYIREEGSIGCNCTLPWTGPLCNIYPTDEKDTSVGMASGSIIAIVISIIALILLVLVAFFLVTYYMRKKNKEEFNKIVVEADADYDIRENVMFYDEEGAGEEDQNAFDLAKLPGHDTETMRIPVESVPIWREKPVGRRRPDDRPDVGNVLHDRLQDAESDPDAPPYDTLITFNEEGAGSDAGSLSSLGSSSSDASQDYDYLNDWGPKFAKLADMYGAGLQE